MHSIEFKIDIYNFRAKGLAVFEDSLKDISFDYVYFYRDRVWDDKIEGHLSVIVERFLGSLSGLDLAKGYVFINKDNYKP